MLKTLEYNRPRSPLRYCGGKAKVAYLLRHFQPQAVTSFREPMVGGGSMFYELAGLFDHYWINDLHEGLIQFYSALRDYPNELIGMIQSHAPAKRGEPMTEPGPRGGAPKNARLNALFDAVKLAETPDAVFQAFRYFVVNRMVFGSGRVNYSLPNRLTFGSSDGWSITTTERLELAAAALQGVRITNCDYLPLLEEVGTDVWVLIDPPYVRNSYLAPTSQLYEHNFTLEDHLVLAEAVKRCNHNCMLCYDDDEDGLVRSLYPERDFWIHPMQWIYAGTTSSEKEIGKELVICNYPPASF